MRLNHRLLMRMSLWVRNPPSTRQAMFILAIVAACVGLFVIERTLGWPEWLTPNDTAKGRL